jgi:putative lipase involved disintegration of autophagic bodies
LDEEIATQTAKINELCCEKEINFAKLIDKQDVLALTERKKNQYQKILDEMFPD